MNVLLVTVVTLTTAIVLCSAADPECKLRMQKGLPAHWPNPSDCGRFYRCTPKNVKREVICPPEREYNQKTGKCALRGKVKCYLSPIARVAHFMCLEGQKRSVPANCSQYELCLNGLWKRTTCNEFTYYNPEQQLCLEPRDDTVCAYAKVPRLPACNEQRENALLPSKTGFCGSYLRCGRGKWRSKNCPKQQYFAVTLQTCITSSNGTNLCQNAEQNRTLLGNALNATSAGNRCVHRQVRVYEHNCAMYFMCLEGEWWFQYCPLGMYFHPKQNYCVPNEAGQCATAQLMPASKEKLDQQQCSREGALRASVSGCEHFYVCVAGRWHQQTCAAQQYFSVAQESCVPEDGTCTTINNGKEGVQKCLEGSRRTFPLNCTAYERCEMGEWVRRECMNSTVFDDVISKCVSNDGTCSSNGLRRACNMEERKAHPQSEHCDEFYNCVGGNWQIGACLKGYKYNKHLGTCVAGTCTKTQEFETASEEEEPLENHSIIHVIVFEILMFFLEDETFSLVLL